MKRYKIPKGVHILVFKWIAGQWDIILSKDLYYDEKDILMMNEETAIIRIPINRKGYTVLHVDRNNLYEMTPHETI